jgi:SnoaL-like polyketide cyclase
MSIGEKVIARTRVTGTNTASFMGMPPTGKGVNVQVIDIVRFGNDGLVYEHRGLMDLMSMMQQLAVVRQSPPGQTPRGLSRGQPRTRKRGTRKRASS